MRPKNILYALPVALTLACAGEEAPVDYPDARAADREHYSVEFENDAIRVLRVAYGPGETSVMHRHPPLCAINLGDATWDMEAPDGEVTESTGSLGTLDCPTEAHVHRPTNTGDAAAEAILVEWKEGATPASGWMPEQPDAATADPGHYTVEFENEVGRIVRVRYGPGETSRMHHHPANCVVYIRDQPVDFRLPTGQVVAAERAEMGAVNCADGEVHLPTNKGTGPLEVILVELKGRASIE